MQKKKKPLILLVDDQKYVRLDIIETLKNRGDEFEFLEAASYLDGLNKFHQRSPDLVILDLQMPDNRGLPTRFAGLALLDEIKSSNQTVPVIINSLYNDKVLIEEAYQRECFAYLVKWESPLLETVYKALAAAGFDTGRPGRKVLPETRQVSPIVRQHMTHIPTGYYHMLDNAKNSLVSYEIKNLTTQVIDVTVTSLIERYSDPMISTVQIEAGGKKEVFHKPILIHEEISQLNELTAATLYTKIDNLTAGRAWEKSEEIYLHARNTALLAIYDHIDNKWKDMSRFLAGWVTPNSPNVQAFLFNIRQEHQEKKLVGYQGAETIQGRTKIIHDQVEAIYNALANLGLGYVQSVINFGLEPDKATQRVRFPADSLSEKNGNCLDGSVLFASLLMAISLNPILVLVPGHAFVGWETWDNSGIFECLETTFIGAHGFNKALAKGNDTYLTYLSGGGLTSPLGDPKGYMRVVALKSTTLTGLFPFE